MEAPQVEMELPPNAAAPAVTQSEAVGALRGTSERFSISALITLKIAVFASIPLLFGYKV